MDFQGYLKQKGWKRFYKDLSVNGYPKVYSDSAYVSSYGPTMYKFEHNKYPDIFFYWGLWIYKKPPTMHLDRINFICKTYDNKTLKRYPVDQDIWFNTFNQYTFDEIYNAYINRETLIIKIKEE